MRFKILEEIKSTLPKYLIYNIIHKSNQMLVFDERGKPEYRGKNLSRQSREPTNSIHIIMTPGTDIEPGPPWWKASAFTTRPMLPPQQRKYIIILINQ